MPGLVISNCVWVYSPQSFRILHFVKEEIEEFGRVRVNTIPNDRRHTTQTYRRNQDWVYYPFLFLHNPICMFLQPLIIPVIMGVFTVSSMPNEDTCFLSSRGPCLPSWQNLGDYCYNVTTQLFNFTKAREGCKELGGFLAVPQHEKETEFIVDLIHLGNAGDHPDFGKGWINCLEEDGTWQCSEGG